MDIQSALASIELGLDALKKAKASLASVVVDPVNPARVVVRAGQNLQAALDRQGAIELEAGAVFEGTYALYSGTIVTGHGAGIRGVRGPAVVVPPGAARVAIAGLELRSTGSEVVVIGVNDTNQTRLDQVPTDILLTDVRIPQHRGKRAFGIHGSHVQLINCEAIECWDPAGQDSQAIYIGNTPGPITVRGGRYSAGSDVVLSGGDTTRIPNVTPTDLLFENVELFRPLSWMTDGVPRKVKNIFEVKNGKRVVVRNAVLHGCWANGQAGEAIVLTPALDGSRTVPPLRSGEVTDVLIEDVVIRNCGSVANILGRAYQAYTVNPLSGVVFRRVTATVNRAQFGGRGQLAIIGGEPADVTFEAVDFTGDGSSLIYAYVGDVLDPVTHVSRQAGKIGTLTLTGSRCTVGEYGLFLSGFANARNWQAAVNQLTVTGNRFSGSTAMRSALPQNEYVP